MKIAIDWTVACLHEKNKYTEEENEVNLNKLEQTIKNILINLEKVYKDNKYILLGSIGVIHHNTARLHGHIRHLVEWTGKVVKCWCDKIRRDILSCFELEGHTVKITVYTEYDAKFSIDDLWTYGLKELEENAIIPMKEHFFNMTDELLEMYRQVGHKRYIISQKENKRNDERKERTMGEMQELFSYINLKRDDWADTMFISGEINTIKCIILSYYKDKYINTGQIKIFKINSIKDIAVNYLLTQTDYTIQDIASIV